ncbi:histidine kinase [Bacteroides pyogenes]|nr:histidine kinase [Bacteroides pyogenes]
MKEHHFMLRFLFAPNYRIGRHVIFIMVWAVITFNQVFIAYQDSQSVLGNRIYLVCLISCMTYLIAMYFNYFYLAPKFLLKGKHTAYAVALCVIVLVLPTLSVWSEYWVRNVLNLPHRITSYTHPLIVVDNLSTSVVTAICFCGISVVLFFGKWIKGNEEVGRMEREHVKSELNKLKGQIAPAFLSQTLKNASSLAASQPEKTSKMLMQLGQLLRYQLYDCYRERILLKSEIQALAVLFELEKSNHPAFAYRIQADGEANNTFVSPMLFLSLVQCVIADSRWVELFFRLQDETLFFTCRSDHKELPGCDIVSPIKQRLELQYPDRHTLQLSGGTIALTINLSQ